MIANGRHIITTQILKFRSYNEWSNYRNSYNALCKCGWRCNFTSLQTASKNYVTIKKAVTSVFNNLFPLYNKLQYSRLTYNYRHWWKFLLHAAYYLTSHKSDILNCTFTSFFTSLIRTNFRYITISFIIVRIASEPFFPFQIAGFRKPPARVEKLKCRALFMTQNTRSVILITDFYVFLTCENC